MVSLSDLDRKPQSATDSMAWLDCHTERNKYNLLMFIENPAKFLWN